MGKTVTFLFTLFFLTGAPQEKYPGFRQVSDQHAFRTQFEEASSKISSITGDFTQEKTLSALTETMISRGKLWYKSEDKVRMDYTAPFVYRVIINGERMSVRDETKETNFNTASSRVFQQINRVMVDCIRGSIFQSKDFTAVAYESDKAWLLEMTPLDRSMKDFLSTIVLTIDKTTGTPAAIELNESLGDKTLIRLSNKVVNGLVDDEIFSF